MINTINLNVKMNKRLKDGFEKICDDKGFTHMKYKLKPTAKFNKDIKLIIKKD